MFQCHSPKSSHPLPLPQSQKDCSTHLCLFCCLAYRVIVTIFLNSIVFDCFYPNVIWWLRGQFLQTLDSWKENYSLGQKKKQTASLCWAVPGLAQNRGSSRGASLLLWNGHCLWAPAVPPWRLQPAGPLSLLPGSGGAIRVGAFFEGRVLRSVFGR